MMTTLMLTGISARGEPITTSKPWGVPRGSAVLVGTKKRRQAAVGCDRVECIIRLGISHCLAMLPAPPQSCARFNVS